MQIRQIYYRVRLPEGDGLTGAPGPWWLGAGLVADVDVLRPVLEPDALCFDRPSMAADAAVRFGAVPFTVEEAR